MATTRSIAAVPRSTAHALTARRWRAIKNFGAAMLFLAPSLLIFLFFVFIPLLKTTQLSLFLTDSLGRAKEFIGPGNYADAFSDGAC